MEHGSFHHQISHVIGVKNCARFCFKCHCAASFYENTNFLTSCMEKPQKQFSSARTTKRKKITDFALEDFSQMLF